MTPITINVIMLLFGLIPDVEKRSSISKLFGNFKNTIDKEHLLRTKARMWKEQFFKIYRNPNKHCSLHFISPSNKTSKTKTFVDKTVGITTAKLVSEQVHGRWAHGW